MANMKEVNKAIKSEFKGLNIEAVRAGGYIYYAGDDGFDQIESLYTNPVTTSTEIVIKLVLQDIKHYLENKE